MRGTFANIRIRNKVAPGTEGGVTNYLPTDEVMPIYDASMKYQAKACPSWSSLAKSTAPVFPRLGCEGHQAPRREGGYRRKL